MKRMLVLGLLEACLAGGAAQAGLYEDFVTPPDAAKPWCYWYWVNGNVDRATVTADLQAMKEMGFGGLLLLDPRGYDTRVQKPPVKLAFASREWYEMVAFAVRECARLGLAFTMNLSDCGGSLKGPWKTGADGPKRLVCGVNVDSVPADYENYHDICTLSVSVPKGVAVKPGWRDAGGATDRWARDDDAASIPTCADGTPGGRVVTLRFGYCAIPKRPFDVDVIDAEAVARHVNRMLDPLCAALGPLVGTTFTHVYSVSWEGAIPTWTPALEAAFAERAGYELRPRLPLLAGFVPTTVQPGEPSPETVLRDFRRVRNALFRESFYGTMRRLAHARGLKVYSESGGPWNRSPSVFLEADQLAALGMNDMPQGEFWPVVPPHHSGAAHTVAAANAARIYGLKRASAEAFTTMDYHWNMLPSRLKRSADDAFVDGINHFVWHTFTCSPAAFGRPGIEYFAGTHINRNVTWQGQAHAFLTYLARCQTLLQAGEPVVDLALYAGHNPYRHWGRYRDLPFDGATIAIPRGYNYDILNDEKLSLKGRYAAFVDATKPGAAWSNLPPPDFEGDFPDVVHRRTADGTDIYFVTTSGTGRGSLTFRVADKACEFWDPVTGNRRAVPEAKATPDGRTKVPLAFARDGSVFVVFRPKGTVATFRADDELPPVMRAVPLTGGLALDGPWTADLGGRIFPRLGDWTKSDDFEIRHFSGTARYRTSFALDAVKGDRLLMLGHVEGGVAEVFVNGVGCGVVWCAPWYAKVPAAALKAGVNELEVRVTNTWRNRLIGDCLVPPERRVTKSCLQYKAGPHNNVRGEWDFSQTTGGYSANDALDSCGLYGPVSLRATRGEEEALDSPAIQRAIDEMSARGGGTVSLPKGVYRCGTIFLRNNVTLNLDEGAVILGSTNASDYARLDKVWFARGSTFALIGATNAVNVALTGKGVIDGRGEGFPGPRTTYSDFAKWEKTQGGFGVRPRLVEFYRTKGIRVEGVKMRQAASWTFFLRECEDVVVRGVQIRSHAYFCNDGIDIEAKRVLIEDCDIDTNDDAICPKSHNPDFCVEDVEVRNCRIASNCSAIKFGTKNRGGFRNFSIRDCTIMPSSMDDPIAASSRRWTDKKTGRVSYDGYGRPDWRYGLEGIAIECVDEGFCENIHIRDVTIEGMMCPFFVRVGRREQPPRNQGDTIRNVLIENIRATKESPVACSVTGVPGRRVQGVTFRNIQLTSKGLAPRFRKRLKGPVPEHERKYPQYSMFEHPLPAWGFYLRHADGIRFEHVTMSLRTGETDARPPFLVDDATATVLDGCNFKVVEETP